MNRIMIIQEIFRRTDFKNYLEIGCATGTSFLPVRAKRKTGVDPFFRISIFKKAVWAIRVFRNLSNRYFEEESDNFFANRKGYLERLGPLDVVLVDGLHTYPNALRDVLNSLAYLNKDGIILMHDCFPPNKAAALPTRSFPTAEEAKEAEGWTGEWCGDVWKAVVYLRKTMGEMLEVCVLNTDYGLGIIRPKGKIEGRHLVIDEKVFSEIDTMTYEEMTKEAQSLLNLKEPEYAATVIHEVVVRSPKSRR